MELIRSLSANRLVIMVTHNPALAEKYADRIIRFSDGRITADSNPCAAEDRPEGFSLKKTSMSFFTALSLSFQHLRTKKGRTFLTRDVYKSQALSDQTVRAALPAWFRAKSGERNRYKRTIEKTSPMAAGTKPDL